MNANLAILATVALLSSWFPSANAAEPKKLLVVSTTLGFRHTSISSTGESAKTDFYQ
jgi:hypothetical protein